MSNRPENKLWKNQIIVVLLLGDDNMSRMVDAAVDDEFLQMHHPSCHLVKLDYESEDANQFRNIYPDGQSPICLVIQQYGLPLKANDFSDIHLYSSDIIRPFLSAQIFEGLDEIPNGVRREHSAVSLDVELVHLLERFERRMQHPNDQVAKENINIRKRYTIIIIRSPRMQQHTLRFCINDTLNEVYNYVDEHIVGHSRYTLSTAYPRRIFTNKERHMTFLQLNLHHNGIVNVILNREHEDNSVLTVATQVVFSIFRTIIDPFVRIVRVVSNLISNVMPSQRIDMQRH